MKYEFIWEGGSTKDTLLGKRWINEPIGGSVRAILFEDHSFHYCKYNLKQVLHDFQDNLLIIESGVQWLINTKGILNIVPPPCPSWFTEQIVPISAALIEDQCYLESEEWFYNIGVEVKVMASEFKNKEERYDAFVIHASEDKNSFVRPLVYKLRLMGYRIWFDEFDLKLGDSIRQTIDKGLSMSDYAIVVISRMFLNKKWPQYELNGMVTREISGKKAVLPIWYDITFDEVMQYSPSIADKKAEYATSDNIEEVAASIAQVLRATRPSS
jgi:hypothetical protein